MMAAGLSKSKADAIPNLAAWFAANPKTAEALPELPDDDVVKALTAVPGIGAWTVNVFLVFNLGRREVCRRAISAFVAGCSWSTGLKTSHCQNKCVKRRSAWRPYRSIASIYLWTQ
jgi:DNA-3-methyladenine glycosylase II